MKRDKETGIDVLICGGGLAGLSFAIEAYRKGHNVRILEKRPDLDDFGDIIAIQSSALYSPKEWPGFLETLEDSMYPSESEMFKSDGTLVGVNKLGDPNNRSIALNRGSLHQALHDYVTQLGIQVEFSANIVEYFETEDYGGVILDDGRKLTADVVAAADGVGSKSWGLVLGHKSTPISSGFALYRVTFPVEEALKNPVVAKMYEGFERRIMIFLGKDVHMVTGKGKKDICWILTHKSDSTASEDWVRPDIPVEKALSFMGGWDEFTHELVKSTPGGVCTHWKLMWRDPQPTYTSPLGRVIQIGDAAHAFLPTSGSGATMAWEDGFSLAACLQVAGKQNVPLGVKVHNKLRFERVACAQKLGFKIREVFHSGDLEKTQNSQASATRPLGDWVLKHDPTEYAYENYNTCAEHILKGTPFTNTNSPKGYTYKPWTVKELLEASARGEVVIDDGDWS
nr:FAD binding domain protein [Colletotrichum truncatum]KAF6790628.1 FAD binding domain protein [Colletotrichum truncatum]